MPVTHEKSGPVPC